MRGRCRWSPTWMAGEKRFFAVAMQRYYAVRFSERPLFFAEPPQNLAQNSQDQGSITSGQPNAAHESADLQLDGSGYDAIGVAGLAEYLQHHTRDLFGVRAFHRLGTQWN